VPQFERSVPLLQTNPWRSAFLAKLAPVCVGMLAMSQAFAAGQSSCQLDRPPRDAVAFSAHGLYFFVFPAALDAKYTGCQTTWEEHGKRVYVLEFKAGEPVHFFGYEPPGHLKDTCDYAARRLRSDEASCPTYDEAKLAIRRPIPDDNISVPTRKDPRR
jgi:hypothetical protein